MWNKIKFIYRAIYERMISKTRLAKELGVKFGERCDFMTRSWGSEPYLIEMGNDVTTSSGVKFVTHDGGMRVPRILYPQYKKADLFGKIIIGNNVFIGMDAMILPGTTIGDNVIIGARSVVKGSVKSNSVYAGVLAKYICSIEEYVEKNKNKYDMTKHLNPEEKKKYLIEKYQKKEYK